MPFVYAATADYTEIGYCQGLNFLAAILLLHGDEACAFGILGRLCTTLLPQYHVPGMAGLHTAQTCVRVLHLRLPPSPSVA